jgi:alkylation response protein AidB-like acyl-CoA dehydrogenase
MVPKHALRLRQRQAHAALHPDQKECPRMFELSKEHEEFRHLVRDFAEHEVAPYVAQWDRDHHFPADLVPKIGELGLFGLVVPESYGGAGLDEGGFTYLCLAIEELGRIDQSIGI